MATKENAWGLTFCRTFIPSISLFLDLVGFNLAHGHTAQSYTSPTALVIFAKYVCKNQKSSSYLVQTLLSSPPVLLALVIFVKYVCKEPKQQLLVGTNTAQSSTSPTAPVIFVKYVCNEPKEQLLFGTNTAQFSNSPTALVIFVKCVCKSQKSSSYLVQTLLSPPPVLLH